MRQLTCTGPSRLEWRDVPEPGLSGPSSALLRPLAVARCEIDPVLIAIGPADAEGFAVGHEAVGEVLAVGDDVTAFEVGDVVACSFQMSCGQCWSCGAGRTALCDQYPILSDYGMKPLSGIEYGGMVSDVVHVPHATAMLAPIPGGVNPVLIASVADNVADGYRAVAPHLAPDAGVDVLVVCHGLRSIALYAALSAVALGARGVTFESDDDETLAMAADLGATANRTDFGRRAGQWPIVVDAGTRAEALLHAVESTAPGGVLHSVSYYPEPLTGLPLGKLYTRGIRLFTGRVHSAAALPDVVALVAAGTLNPGAIPPTVVPWHSVPDRYLDPAVKLVVVR